MKTCPGCKLTKEETDFHKCPSRKNGVYEYCKVCSSKRGQKWYWENRERSLKNKRITYAKNIEKERERNRLRNNEPKNKSRRKLKSAVKSGIISKPKTCSKCGRESLIHGHHEDYSKPYDVVWLCSSCHSDLHRTLAY